MTGVWKILLPFGSGVIYHYSCNIVTAVGEDEHIMLGYFC